MNVEEVCSRVSEGLLRAVQGRIAVAVAAGSGSHGRERRRRREAIQTSTWAAEKHVSGRSARGEDRNNACSTATAAMRAEEEERCELDA